MTFPASRVGFAVHHARNGERVLMVVPERRRIAQVLTMLAHFGTHQGERLIRASGVEGFTANRMDPRAAGGWIHFATEAEVLAHRDHVADLVLVDADVAWTDDLAEALKLCAARVHTQQETR